MEQVKSEQYIPGSQLLQITKSRPHLTTMSSLTFDNHKRAYNFVNVFSALVRTMSSPRSKSLLPPWGGRLTWVTGHINEGRTLTFTSHALDYRLQSITVILNLTRGPCCGRRGRSVMTATYSRAGPRDPAAQIRRWEPGRKYRKTGFLKIHYTHEHFPNSTEVLS